MVESKCPFFKDSLCTLEPVVQCDLDFSDPQAYLECIAYTHERIEQGELLLLRAATHLRTVTDACKLHFNCLRCAAPCMSWYLLMEVNEHFRKYREEK